MRPLDLGGLQPRQVYSTSILDVHFAHVSDSMVKGVTSSGIHCLFGLHGSLHDTMVSLESLNVISIRCKNLFLDSLAQAVLANRFDDFGAVLFLGIDPTDQLVHFLQTSCRMQILRFDHGLANSNRVLLELADHGRIVKDSTGNLAMPTAQTQDKVES